MNKDGKQIILGYAVLVVALVAFGAIMIWQNSTALKAEQHSLVSWQGYTPEKVAEAHKSGRPVMVNFHAVWSAPCREMDYEIFSLPAVAEAATNLVALRVDVSDVNNEFSRKLAMQHSITGLPTYVFLGTNGEELTGLRLLGKEAPAQLIERLRAAGVGK
jgi:thiol:disulfide interchange protein